MGDNEVYFFIEKTFFSKIEIASQEGDLFYEKNLGSNTLIHALANSM